MIIKMLSK